MTKTRPIMLISICILQRADEVLLLKRSEDKEFFAGKWDCIGGVIEPGETPLVACQREVREEVGIEIQNPRLSGIYFLVDQVHNCETVMFACTANEFIGDIPTSCADGLLQWKKPTELVDEEIVCDLQAILKDIIEVSPAPVLASAVINKDAQIRYLNRSNL